MNPPPEKTDPPRRRGFFTRKRLLLLLGLGIVTGFVLLIANQEGDGPQPSSSSVLEILRDPTQWPEKLQVYYEWKRGLAAERKLIQQKTTEFGPEDPKVLEARKDYAWALIRFGKKAAGAAELRSILPILERVFGPDHVSVQETRQALAAFCMDQDKYDQAEVLYRAMLKTQERAGDKEADETLNILYHLADCLMKQGKRGEAIPYAQRAVDGFRQVIGSNDLERAYIERHIKYAETLLEDLQRKK